MPDGRVLVETLAASAVPKQLAGATNLKLAQLYEQLNASFGRFSQDTLVAATAGIKSADETKYASVDAALTTLTARREVVAGKIKTALNRAAFNGKQINAKLAARWLAAGTKVLADAAKLKASPDLESLRGDEFRAEFEKLLAAIEPKKLP